MTSLPLRRSRPRAITLVGAAAAVGIALAALTGCAPDGSAGSVPTASRPTTDSATADPAPAATTSAAPTAAPSTAPSAAPSQSSTGAAARAATQLPAPVPATRTAYAKNIPAYPPDGRHGRRIVYSKALMHVWIVNADDTVARHYPVTGRWDRPVKGVYKVYSKSTYSQNAHSKASFRWMVRFAWGTTDEAAPIGFHSIPIYYADNPERNAHQGDRMSKLSDLGLPVATGGCVRQKDADAEFLYRWARVGDTVVVLPTAD